MTARHHRNSTRWTALANTLNLITILVAANVESAVSFSSSSPRISMVASSHPRSKKKQKTAATFTYIKDQPPQQPQKPKSVGEVIQRATTIEELMDAASTLWLPSDENLAPHLSTQQIHHEKRQRWSSQLLQKLGCIVSYANKESSTDNYEFIWNDDRLARAVMAAALKFSPDTLDRPEKEGRCVCNALEGLHALAGMYVPPLSVHRSIIEGIETLVERANTIAPQLSLREVTQTRWAAKGLLLRIHPEPQQCNILDNLEQRILELPFDIIPLGVDWTSDLLEHGEIGDSVIPTLRDAIPFNFDTIRTRTGASVTERRGTAWLAQEGIGALAYSGKLMTPHSPLPSVVSAVMRAAEESMDVPLGFFDCALCNHYPTLTSACKFHTDPEHGVMWDPLTCVVAAGDHRRFAFRPIPGKTTWAEWENDTEQASHQEGDEATAPAVIRLFPGDVVKMWGRCNDDFHHAVYISEDGLIASDDDVAGEGRVSLVFKRAIDRGGGKKGHGLEGEGRRSRRKRQ